MLAPPGPCGRPLHGGSVDAGPGHERCAQRQEAPHHHHGPCGHRAGGLLDRDFTAAAPNTRWVADFTYVRTRAGCVYVAFVVDVFAQRIVGWHAATTNVTDLVLTPLRIAMWDRDRHGHPVEPGTLVCHSDAGSQYTSLRYTEHLALEGIAPSIGTVGDAYDNGPMESIIGLYKTEAIATDVFHAGPLKTPGRRRRVRHRWLGRLVEPPPAALQQRPDPTGRARAGLRRCPQPRAAPRIGAAENP